MLSHRYKNVHTQIFSFTNKGVPIKTQLTNKVNPSVIYSMLLRVTNPPLYVAAEIVGNLTVKVLIHFFTYRLPRGVGPLLSTVGVTYGPAFCPL